MGCHPSTAVSQRWGHEEACQVLQSNTEQFSGKGWEACHSQKRACTEHGCHSDSTCTSSSVPLVSLGGYRYLANEENLKLGGWMLTGHSESFLGTASTLGPPTCIDSHFTASSKQIKKCNIFQSNTCPSSKPQHNANLK